MNYTLDTQPLVNASIIPYRLTYRFRLTLRISESLFPEYKEKYTDYAAIVQRCVESVDYLDGTLQIKLRVPECISIEEIEHLFNKTVEYYQLEILSPDTYPIEILKFRRSTIDPEIHFNIGFNYAECKPLTLTVKFVAHMTTDGHIVNNILDTPNKPTDQIDTVSTVSTIVT